METVFQNNNRFASADCCWTLIIEVKMASLLWQGSDRKRATDVQDGGGGGGGVLQEKLGMGVRPASQNPYPIYDQNLLFSLPYL